MSESEKEETEFVQEMRDLLKKKQASHENKKTKLIIDSLEASPQVAAEPLPSDEQFDEDFTHYNISIDVRITKKGRLLDLEGDILSSVGKILSNTKSVPSSVPLRSSKISDK